MSCVLAFILSCDQQYLTCVPTTVVEEKKVLKWKMNKGVAGYVYLYDLNSRTNTVFAM